MKRPLSALALALIAPASAAAQQPDYADLVEIYLSGLSPSEGQEIRDLRHLWATGAQLILEETPCSGEVSGGILPQLTSLSGLEHIFSFTCTGADHVERRIFADWSVIMDMPPTPERVFEACRAEFLLLSEGHLDPSTPEAQYAVGELDDAFQVEVVWRLPSIADPLTIIGDCRLDDSYRVRRVSISTR